MNEHMRILMAYDGSSYADANMAMTSFALVRR